MDLAATLFRWIVGLAFLAGLILLLVYLFQRRLIYFPDPTSVLRPDVEGLEDVTFSAVDGVELRAWFVSPPSGAPTVLVFHGNAGHRGDRVDLVRWFRRAGVGVLALDYRGYGGSEGRPTEEGLYADAEAAVRWLEEDRGIRDRVYFGESLGTGVAVELATRRAPGAMILEAPFDSAVALAERAYPFLPVSWLLKDRFRSDLKMDRIACPLLVLHGSEDELIPIEHARRLFERANAPKRFVEIEDAGHNDLRLAGERYFGPVATFLASVR